MILSRQFQRLGDLAAGTIVVIEERSPLRGFTRVKNPAADALLPWLPPRIAAGSDLALRSVGLRRRARPVRARATRHHGRAAGAAAPARFGLSNQATADAVLVVYHRVFVGD